MSPLCARCAVWHWRELHNADYIVINSESSISQSTCLGLLVLCIDGGGEFLLQNLIKSRIRNVFNCKTIQLAVGDLFADGFC